jgi:hypothetical protein
MPLNIINNDGTLSLRQLQEKMQDGCSVVKSPHVGNQHPSNLVCAALGIPFNVVTFTLAERDTNFHPHKVIANGASTQIADASVWTPFSKSDCGQTLETYHLDALRTKFPRLPVRTDMELMRTEQTLVEIVLRVITATVPRLWYRSVSGAGQVNHLSGNPVTDWNEINQDVFGLSNLSSGWVVPNNAHILFELVLQSLSSGKDTVYHLSGPQMVGYIGGAQKKLSKAYDVLRAEYPVLPETLSVHIVPVASARMVTHKGNSVAFEALEATVLWYERLDVEAKRYSGKQFSALTMLFPEFTESIESGTFMSQYDIDSADDLLISQWMLDAPLKRVEGVYQQLLRSARS